MLHTDTGIWEEGLDWSTRAQGIEKATERAHNYSVGLWLMPAHATTALWEPNTAECTGEEATSYKLKVEVNVGVGAQRSEVGMAEWCVTGVDRGILTGKGNPERFVGCRVSYLHESIWQHSTGMHTSCDKCWPIHCEQVLITATLQS